MANDFDQFPTYDPLIKSGTDKMSAVWADFMATFYMNLIGYMSAYGFYLPNLTQTQINSIQHTTINGVKSPQNGQLLYNLTVDAPQFYQASSSSWRTISFT